MDAFVLAGGLGSRLQSEVGATQKTMADVGGRPFLDIIIEHLCQQGIERVVLCTGFHADKVEEYYRHKACGIKVVFSREGEKLGTGGAVKNAAALVQSDHFFVMNGDSFCPINFIDFGKFHESCHALASIAVSRVNEAEDYGSILLDEETSAVTFFGEKIAPDAAELQNEKAFVNNGIYCFERDIFALMPPAKQFSLEKDFFPQLVGKAFFGFKTNQDFIDIGIPQRYKQAQERFRLQE